MAMTMPMMAKALATGGGGRQSQPGQRRAAATAQARSVPEPGLSESRIARIARRPKQPNRANREALYEIAESRNIESLFCLCREVVHHRFTLWVLLSAGAGSSSDNFIFVCNLFASVFLVSLNFMMFESLMRT